MFGRLFRKIVALIKRELWWRSDYYRLTLRYDVRGRCLKCHARQDYVLRKSCDKEQGRGCPCGKRQILIRRNC